MDEPVCAGLWSKIDEEIERTDHLIAILPAAGLDFVPPIPGSWPTGVLLGHLLECLAGVCAVLGAAHPERLRHFEQLRELPVNHRCGKDEAWERIGVYRARIEEGFGLLRQGMNSSWPRSSSSLAVGSPEATAMIRSTISSPTWVSPALPSTIRPQLMSK